MDPVAVSATGSTSFAMPLTSPRSIPFSPLPGVHLRTPLLARSMVLIFHRLLIILSEMKRSRGGESINPDLVGTIRG